MPMRVKAPEIIFLRWRYVEVPSQVISSVHIYAYSTSQCHHWKQQYCLGNVNRIGLPLLKPTTYILYTYYTYYDISILQSRPSPFGNFVRDCELNKTCYSNDKLIFTHMEKCTYKLLCYSATKCRVYTVHYYLPWNNIIILVLIVL